MKKLAAAALAGFALAAVPSATLDITTHEGTSMAVTVSPDGQTLAVDLQGSIWTLPATGGTAKRITDPYNDARQPAWSPDGKWIAFAGFRDGGYAIWAVAPDGTNLHKLTNSAFDDREPAWSHDGKQLAFASDRSGSYQIWVLDTDTGALRQVTRDAGEDRMPTWSPNDAELAFAASLENGQSIWAVSAKGGAAHKVATGNGVLSAPSWGPGGKIVYHSAAAGASALASDGKVLTGSENAFPFRAAWVSGSGFFYTADGKVRRRNLSDGESKTIEFTARLQATPAAYTHRRRDFDTATPRKALGIAHPALSPDGHRVAFAALGDIYIREGDGRLANLTRDAAFDADPAWSPDGKRLVWSTDRGGQLLQLWSYDFTTGTSQQLTNLTTQPLGAAWSPDGTKIAFIEVTALWGEGHLSVLDVATGQIRKVHETLFAPGSPTWSPDGKRLALAALAPFSKSFREGTNQVLSVSLDGSPDKWFSPAPNLSIDSRSGAGPVWSPDGTRMAAVYEGGLAVWPVSPAGEPTGPVRHLTTELAHAPSWSGDSKTLLYQANDRLRTINTETGEVRDLSLNLSYTLAVPKGRTVVHAGQLVDGKSTTARANADIVIEGNRIRSVLPHAAANHTGAKVVDASGLTVMPGLIEYHTHLQSDYGGAEHRAWLAFGITTVRSPGTEPYEAVEDREANEAGVRPGPRIFAAGYMLEWQRLYYKASVAVSSPQHLEAELNRSKILRHDLLKSYVRLPDLQQKYVVEFAHSIGIPVATHEIYPAAFVGMDTVEHTGATSRRGYSPKIATLQHSYEDVIQLLGKTHTIFCPMIIGPGSQRLLAAEPAILNDPRFALYPEWVRAGLRTPATGRGGRGGNGTGGSGQMVMDAMKAGARIVAGTDTPNAFSLHGEMASYVMAGMTPYEALRAATVNPAEALGLDAGSLEPGKLADLVIVEGNPLEDIANAHRVKRVVANGRLWEMDELLRPNR